MTRSMTPVTPSANSTPSKGKAIKNATQREIETGEEMLADELNSLTAEHAARERKYAEAGESLIDELNAL
jgi:hypothetical protein